MGVVDANRQRPDTVSNSGDLSGLPLVCTDLVRPLAEDACTVTLSSDQAQTSASVPMTVSLTEAEMMSSCGEWYMAQSVLLSLGRRDLR